MTRVAGKYKSDLFFPHFLLLLFLFLLHLTTFRPLYHPSCLRRSSCAFSSPSYLAQNVFLCLIIYYVAQKIPKNILFYSSSFHRYSGHNFLLLFLFFSYIITFPPKLPAPPTDSLLWRFLCSYKKNLARICLIVWGIKSFMSISERRFCEAWRRWCWCGEYLGCRVRCDEEKKLFGGKFKAAKDVKQNFFAL